MELFVFEAENHFIFWGMIFFLIEVVVWQSRQQKGWTAKRSMRQQGQILWKGITDIQNLQLRLSPFIKPKFLTLMCCWRIQGYPHFLVVALPIQLEKIVIDSCLPLKMASFEVELYIFLWSHFGKTARLLNLDTLQNPFHYEISNKEGLSLHFAFFENSSQKYYLKIEKCVF